jgi:hypothetical protein
LPVSQLSCIGAIVFGEREYAEWVMPRSVRRAAEVLDLFSVERPYWGPSEVAVRQARTRCWASWRVPG